MRVSPFVVLLALCTSACTLSAKNIEELRYPGFVDVGAGYAVAFNTRDGANNDADGYLLSLKAYPFGRWYSKPKSTGEKELTETSAAIVKGKLDLTDLSGKVSEAKEHVDNAKKILAKDAANVGECVDCVKEAKKLLAGAKQTERVKPLLDHLKTIVPDEPTENVPQASDLEKASNELAQEKEKVDKELEGIPEAIARLTEAKDDALNEEFYVVQANEKECWWPKFYRRLSVFYGTSMGNFEGGGLESSVNVIGVAFDLAPQLAIQVGWGYYDVDDGTGTGTSDTDSGWVGGISLNLAAFRWMFSSLGD